MTDNQLLAAFIDGDLNAMAELHRRHADKMALFVHLRYLHGQPGGEDVAQRAFVYIMRHARDFNPKYQAAPWMYSVAARIAQREFNARRRRNRAEYAYSERR